MERYLELKKSGNSQLPNQPYLLVLLNGQRQVTRTFVIIDYNALPANSVQKGIDLLYKSFYVFNLKYPSELEPTYSFFDIIHDEEALVSKTVREKYNLMNRSL
jgi:hypothetical protein